MTAKHNRGQSRSDANVLEQAERIALIIALYIAALQIRFPKILSDEFFKDFFNCISLGRSLPSDIALRGVQKKFTAELKPLFARFDKLFGDIIIAVRHAFPDDPVVQSEFGILRKSEIVANPASLLVYLCDFALFWAKYGVALLAADCPATMPDDIAQLEKDLATAKSMQGAAKVDRHGKTFDRVTNINTLWAKLLKLEECVVALYGKDSHEAMLFHIDRGSSGAEDTVVPPSGPKPKAE